MPEKAGFVDGEIFDQLGQFRFAFLADQQPVVGVEGIDVTLAQPAQQPVLQEVSAALVEVHAALLINQGLQQPKFRLRQDRSRCRSKCAHAFSRSPRPRFNFSARKLSGPKPRAPRPSRACFLRPRSAATSSPEPATCPYRATRLVVPLP